MIETNELLDLALQLPCAERARLVRQLLLSLEPEDTEVDHEEAWRLEIEQRLTRLDAGQTTASDWKQAVARIRQSLALRTAP